MPLLVWNEGPKQFGCSYHKLCRFDHDRGHIQVDVFVMETIAKRRPIAVTISSYTKDGSEVAREKLGFKSVNEAAGAASSIEDALISAGLSPRSHATRYANAIVEFIGKKQAEIQSALEKIRA